MKKVVLFLGVSTVLVLATYRNSLRAQVTQVDASLPVYTAAGTAIPNAHAVVGHLRATRGGDTVTLTGPAVYTGAETYSCTVSIERGGPIAANATAIDGSHFLIVPSIGFQVYNGTRDGWKEDFICVGN
jgi:hypothetical protein